MTLPKGVRQVCYGLCIEWAKAVCKKEEPTKIRNLGILHRAILNQYAYHKSSTLKADRKSMVDPFVTHVIDNKCCLDLEEEFRIRSHNSFDTVVRHLFSENFFHKKIIAFNEYNSFSFAYKLAQHASDYDAVLIFMYFLNNNSTPTRSGHILAISCSTGTPVLFDPDYGHYIYEEFNGERTELAHAIKNYYTQSIKTFLHPASLMQLTAVGLSKASNMSI